MAAESREESEATTAESRDPSRAGTDEDVLMPGSAPQASPRRPDRPADKHTRRYGSTDTEGEFAALGDQLEALDDDIDDARVYGGIHFRFDQAAGAVQGRAVGLYVCQNNLRSIGGESGTCRE